MKKNYKLKRFEEAYIYATRITDRNQLIEFGKTALFHLDIEYGLFFFVVIILKNKRLNFFFL